MRPQPRALTPGVIVTVGNFSNINIRRLQKLLSKHFDFLKDSQSLHPSSSRIHLLSYLSGVEAPVLAEGYRVLDPGGATPDKVDGHVLPVIVVAAVQAEGITSTLQPVP